MGKIKKLLDFDFDFELNEEEMNQELYARNDYDYQFKQWKESEDYVDFVNEEMNTARPIYTEFDIEMATKYASSHITIEPSEVGKEVYDKLFIEKINEYLTSKQ
tara:strand:+ start:1464 stop:1775 length:312 start_codon:yes stop_codon:yes gene_type:complete